MLFVKLKNMNYISLLKKNTRLVGLNFKIATIDNFSYKRLGLIDSGTYGNVFKVKNCKFKKLYACKEIKLAGTKDGLNLIALREINILLSISHPNIIFVREARMNFLAEKFFIIMEYCNYDIKSILDSTTKFSQNQIKMIIKQLLYGISALHDSFVIHRDLKTSNILLNKKGVLKICDFGMARIFNKNSKFLSQEVITLWYRPPEILLGKKNYTNSVDLWAMGCILSELTTSNVLFSGKSELDQLIKIFGCLGAPTSEIWLNLHSYPSTKKIIFPLQPYNSVFSKMYGKLDPVTIDLIQKFLVYDPVKRISARCALRHKFFKNVPYEKK